MSGDFDAPTGIDWRGDVGVVKYGAGDKGQVVIFYTKPVPNQAKSIETGRPVSEDVVHVKIHPPGERLNIVDRPALASDRQRWPLQWQQFKDQQQQIPDGTPIEFLYPDKPSIAQMLRAHGVHTVEQCATLSANAIENVGMGSQNYVNDANRYISVASKGIGAAALRRELDERDGRIRTLERQLEMTQQEVKRISEANAVAMDRASAVTSQMAGHMQRPVYPNSGNHQYIPPAFDPQAAQIAATHVTKDIASTKREKRTRPKLRA